MSELKRYRGYAVIPAIMAGAEVILASDLDALLAGAREKIARAIDEIKARVAGLEPTQFYETTLVWQLECRNDAERILSILGLGGKT